MRLLDLFNSLDADGSKSLSREEFRQGLMVRTIQLSNLPCKLGYNSRCTSVYHMRYYEFPSRFIMVVDPFILEI